MLIVSTLRNEGRQPGQVSIEKSARAIATQISLDLDLETQWGLSQLFLQNDSFVLSKDILYVRRYIDAAIPLSGLHPLVSIPKTQTL